MGGEEEGEREIEILVEIKTDVGKEGEKVQ